MPKLRQFRTIFDHFQILGHFRVLGHSESPAICCWNLLMGNTVMFSLILNLLHLNSLNLLHINIFITVSLCNGLGTTIIT